MATPDQIRTTINAYPKCYATKDKAGWLALFADDASIEDPIGSEIRSGQDGLSEFWDFTRSLADEIELELTGPVCVAGHEAAFPFRITVTAGGARMGLDAVDTMTFTDDARIQSMRAYWDPAEMTPLADD